MDLITKPRADYAVKESFFIGQRIRKSQEE
jgi:hypothetical protein